MAKPSSRGVESPGGAPAERRGQARSSESKWRTSLTLIEPNKILVRGYPLDELMGRVSFAEAIYLLLIGELPTASIGRMMDALLVSSIDHGVTPPSTLAARNVATSGAPLHASVGAGVLAFGRYHGGDIETCMRFLDSGLALVRGGLSYEQAAEHLRQRCDSAGETPPGFGHRFHSRDPRAARLFQMALELELEGEHIRLIRALERAIDAKRGADRPPLPINVDGAIAAVCGDLGLHAEIGNALFIISRVPGIIAQAAEEQARNRPMRQIDPKDHVYDGPAERRLPATRK
ncbi:MAG: citryl-CoA lyase [Acidobacteria bacterium]|nr:citryl-CoA lyase [Acidobacteriota bacterium]